jgi:hypothetical protein
MDDAHQQIEDLYDFALENLENEYRVVDIFQIGAELARQIFEATGVDIEGFMVSIDNYSILHTLQRHGNPVKEAKHGQIAVTKSDFTKLPEILSAPDSVRLDIIIRKNGVQRDTLIFSKVFEHRYFVLKEIRSVSKKGKTNRLILQTMYIRQNP